MPPIPSWVLGLFFWLHMLATVTWIGSLVAISMLVLPAAKGTLSPTDQLRFLTAMQKRLEPVAWFSMGLLVVTGLFQLSSNPHYDGFLSTSGQWSIAILVKHSLAVIMAATSATVPGAPWDLALLPKSLKMLIFATFTKLERAPNRTLDDDQTVAEASVSTLV